MDGQVEAVRQGIGSVKDEIVKTKQDLAAAKEGRNGEHKMLLLLSLNNQLSGLQEEKHILLHGQAPGVPPTVLDVHVGQLSRRPKYETEYDVPAGVIRSRDFEKALGIELLKCALSTSKASVPGAALLVDKAYFSNSIPKVAVGTKELPSNTTSLWLKAKHEGGQPWFLKLFKPDFSTSRRVPTL